MDKMVTEPTITMAAPNLEHYERAAIQLDQLKHSKHYDRITLHDVNNSLGKINNALWLMAREENTSTPLFRTCQQIVERELGAAHKMLSVSEEASP